MQNTPREIEGILKEEYKKYQVRTSIHHWQLRDMITTTTKFGEVVYAHSNTINLLNTETQKSHTLVKNLVFNPTSICYGHGMVAIGGQRSQLVIKNIATGAEKRICTGGSINNGVEIFDHFGDLRVLVCNNDETIKEYSLGAMRKSAVLMHKAPVNSCAVSPDGRFLATVGDNNDVNLFSIGRDRYKLKTTMKATNDASFKVSWSPSSTYLAASTQDGYVCIYDIRNTAKKISTISSMQSPLVKGACRNVKFCPKISMDLLAFTEHVSHFTLVDTRDFTKKQSIALASPETDRHISGMAFSPCGESLFVGTEMLIFEFEIDSLRRRLHQVVNAH
ncbi:hypothetical protein NEHOM01_1434 [Nematocida homosporus]|uniref:uncharacterized protein n=1 Tax=Nematocida homosporus TaxID=1912981 RepID=UPI00221EFA6A|nr:uncharacterized protein NEHOM01_1434 [Nematocida homosporus]KAI5186380.1 hypothetical protein NEHOM01_1434 [Nematocida homosporus]